MTAFFKVASIVPFGILCENLMDAKSPCGSTGLFSALNQAGWALLASEAAPCHILHQPMNTEFLALRIAPHQRIAGKIGKRFLDVLGRDVGHPHVDHEIRHQLRRKPAMKKA
jgi:hypothetical protein